MFTQLRHERQTRTSVACSHLYIGMILKLLLRYCWVQMKTYIPKSLSSQSKQIPLRIRSWQWRFTHAEHDNLLQLFGTQVAKL